MIDWLCRVGHSSDPSLPPASAPGLRDPALPPLSGSSICCLYKSVSTSHRTPSFVYVSALFFLVFTSVCFISLRTMRRPSPPQPREP